MTVVFTNGVFDLLHVGHIRLLHFARLQGDWLVVAINSDASARRIKGPSRPVIPAEERAEMLFALRCVDDVRIFDEDTPDLLIQRLRPQVLVKGPACRGTDIPGAAFVESIGGRVVIPDWPVEHSSTQLVGRIIRTVGAIG
jgi:D-beta-D-heptose 7-phosphate kinase/D-beta-D-heptose 1-phosphate adenosyltransferase